MTYAQLRAFHAVAQCGGFSKAASLLSLTQPAISDHVRKLEEAHGVQLFHRGARGITLTETGRKLFTITERQFEAEAQAQDLLMRAQALEEGQLTIGADAAVHVLAQLTRFRKQHPRIALRLVSGNSADLIAKLIAFTIDVAVTAERPQNDMIGALKLRQDRLLVAVPRQGPWPKVKAIKFAALCAAPLILRESGSATRKLLLDEMQNRNITRPPSMEVEGREAMCEAVAQGLGVAVLSAGEVGADRRLRFLEVADWSVVMEEWLLFLKARADLHLIRTFIQAAAS
jgi:aminoethylphosphonate catabolism LysR family transcriptional regulator